MLFPSPACCACSTATPSTNLIAAIRDLDWKWVAFASRGRLSVYVTHGWRWNTLLGPVARLKLWRTVQAIYIGLFTNEVLPLRIGELIRMLPAGPLERTQAFGRSGLGRGGTADRRFLAADSFMIAASFVRGIPEDLKLLVEGTGITLIARGGRPALGGAA